ncbi:MAG: NAD(P)H:quinone oxidoreductase [Proteobacteria bacterium]|nr:NAD(P)H:quinone oxidoreductase [Pseudomonadota bacterium]
MTKVLVLYYSSWGHMEAMAYAAAEGAKEGGAKVDVMRVPELVPEEVQKSYHYKTDQKAPVAKPDDLAGYDGFIFAVPTRYGMMASQMKNFLDQTGGLWAKGALLGKPGAVMAGAGNQHGGQVPTILSFQTVLLHHGMVIVGLPYAYKDQMGHDVIRGGSPYGATTTTGGDGSRMPSEQELDGAKWQGNHLAKIAAKLAAK